MLQVDRHDRDVIQFEILANHRHWGSFRELRTDWSILKTPNKLTYGLVSKY